MRGAQVPEIRLVRQPSGAVTPDELREAVRVLTRVVDGVDPVNGRRWRRFLVGLLALADGATALLTTVSPRHARYHRMHMKFEQRIFESQEQFSRFDPGFRDWIKVGAGLVEWIPNPHGDGVVPVPKSISYTAMEEGEMREFHENCMDFLRTERAQATLWPHAKPSTRELWMDTLLDEFTPDWERA